MGCHQHASMIPEWMSSGQRLLVEDIECGIFDPAIIQRRQQIFLDKMYAGPNANRYTGITMCTVFLLGLVVLPFLPETKDKPLPE